MDTVTRDEFERMTRGNLGSSRAIDQMTRSWDGGDRSGFGENFQEMNIMFENFMKKLKKE